MRRSEEVLRVLRASGVDVIHDESLPVAGVMLSGGGYKLVLGSVYTKAKLAGDDQACVSILSHELMHIIRGDCLKARGKVPEFWNIAADAAINSRSMVDSVEKFSDGKRGVFYGNIFESLGLPSFVQPASVIYEALLRHSEAFSFGSPLVSDSLQCEDSANVEVEHVAAALKLRDEVARSPVLGGEFKEAVGKLASVGGFVSSQLPKARALPFPSLALDAIRRLLVNKGRVGRVRVRSYTREGRSELLPGRAYVGFGRLVLALDTSGSVFELLPLFHGLAGQLGRFWRFSVVLWSDGPYWQGDFAQLSMVRVASGGTSFEGVGEWVDRLGAHVCVVVTDGEIFGTWKPPACPVVWVLVNGEKVRGGYIRPCDSVFVIRGGG